MSNVVKCHIKKGDTVEVIAGDDKGKSGKVLQILPQAERALVEGLNYAKKHMKATQDNPQGGVVDIEAPIAISNLKVSK
jgi:large subunit ribosomal protein L24